MTRHFEFNFTVKVDTPDGTVTESEFLAHIKTAIDRGLVRPFKAYGHGVTVSEVSTSEVALIREALEEKREKCIGFMSDAAITDLLSKLAVTP